MRSASVILLAAAGTALLLAGAVSAADAEDVRQYFRVTVQLEFRTEIEMVRHEPTDLRGPYSAVGRVELRGLAYTIAPGQVILATGTWLYAGNLTINHNLVGAEYNRKRNEYVDEPRTCPETGATSPGGRSAGDATPFAGAFARQVGGLAGDARKWQIDITNSSVNWNTCWGFLGPTTHAHALTPLPNSIAVKGFTPSRIEKTYRLRCSAYTRHGANADRSSEPHSFESETNANITVVPITTASLPRHRDQLKRWLTKHTWPAKAGFGGTRSACFR